MNFKNICLKSVIICAFAATLVAAGCGQPVVKAPVAQPMTASINGSVHEITLLPEVLTFPEHEGKKEFTAYCNICHSLKYITMQPDFPEKTWEAEVEKMMVKYNAPIDTPTAAKIVSYIMAIKGKK